MPDTSLSRPAARGFTTLLAPVLRAVAAAEPNAVVLIDGPSGAGKSTLADAVVAAWPGTHRPTLVRLDDIYPGWQGLDAAIEQVYTRLLAPRRAGLPGQWQRFDWVRGEPAEWNRVDPQHPLAPQHLISQLRFRSTLTVCASLARMRNSPTFR